MNIDIKRMDPNDREQRILLIKHAQRSGNRQRELELTYEHLVKTSWYEQVRHTTFVIDGQYEQHPMFVDSEDVMLKDDVNVCLHWSSRHQMYRLALIFERLLDKHNAQLTEDIGKKRMRHLRRFLQSVKGGVRWEFIERKNKIWGATASFPENIRPIKPHFHWASLKYLLREFIVLYSSYDRRFSLAEKICKLRDFLSLFYENTELSDEYARQVNDICMLLTTKLG